MNERNQLLKRIKETEKILKPDHKLIRESLFKLNMGQLRTQMQICKDWAKQEFDSEDEAIPHKALLAKEFIKLGEQIIEATNKRYPELIRYSKEDIYPRSWMLNDNEIMAVFIRYPFILSLLNYINNLSRRAKGVERKKMIDVQRDNDVLVRAGHSSGTTGDGLKKHTAEETLASDPQFAVGVLVVKAKLVEAQGGG